LPPGDGRDLTAAVCAGCHSLRPVLMLRDGPAGWKETVQEMVKRGAPLLPQEAETVAQYLAKNLGPAAGPMPSGTAVSLPAGAGRELVESRCALCHDLGRVAASPRSKVEWEVTVKNMVKRGAVASPEQMQTIISYLTAQFGKKTD
jgi:mono/diheme cytochrome c family protein